jgi:hypothetical protein
MSHGKFIRKERSIQETKPYAQGISQVEQRITYLFGAKKARDDRCSAGTPHGTGQVHWF